MFLLALKTLPALALLQVIKPYYGGGRGGEGGMCTS